MHIPVHDSRLKLLINDLYLSDQEGSSLKVTTKIELYISDSPVTLAGLLSASSHRSILQRRFYHLSEFQFARRVVQDVNFPGVKATMR